MEKNFVLSELRDEIPLSCLNIAGTHDSATAFVDFESRAQCQSLTIEQQLLLGIRLFDIRLFLKNDEFFLVHSRADCYKSHHKAEKLSFRDVFICCTEFLKENPNETIIMSIKKDRGVIAPSFFSCFYDRFIRANKDLWFLENRVPTLGECRGKIVLMRRCKRKKNFEPRENCGLDFSFWKDQASRTKTNPLPVRLSEGCSAIVQDRYTLAPNEKWNLCAKPFLEKCTVSQNALSVHFLSTSGGRGIPRENAEAVNACFSEYNLKASSAQGWFFLDFPTQGLCDKIMQSNLTIYKKDDLV